MSTSERLRTIAKAEPLSVGRLRLIWSDGTTAEIDLSDTLKQRPFAALRDAQEFAAVQIGDWGHSLAWRCGAEIGADSLWLEMLSATGRGDVRQFLEWRLRNSLSLAKAAEVLGISRRSVAYYAKGEHKIPRAILLACIGWEVETGRRHAA